MEAAVLLGAGGETKPSELYDASKGMYDSMSEEELEEMEGTQRKGKQRRNGMFLQPSKVQY